VGPLQLVLSVRAPSRWALAIVAVLFVAASAAARPGRLTLDSAGT